MDTKICYELIRDNTWGRLLCDVLAGTGITGYSAVLTRQGRSAELDPSGLLVVRAGFEWDFGTGPVLQTPAMVRASLIHDVLCDMTNQRLVPWAVRAQADALFREHLREYSPGRHWLNPLRYHYWWRWAAVSAYSQLIARWKDKADPEAMAVEVPTDA